MENAFSEVKKHHATVMHADKMYGTKYFIIKTVIVYQGLKETGDHDGKLKR